MDRREKDLIARLGIHIEGLTNENERLRDRIESERAFRDKVYKKAQDTYSIDELLKASFPLLKKLMNSSRGSIVLKSQDPLDKGSHFYVVAQEGISDDDIETKLMSLEKGKYIATALESGQSVVIDTRRKDHRTNSIIVPFGWEDLTQGAVCISNNLSSNDYSEEDRLTLTSCVGDIENVIKIIIRERRHLEGIASFVEQRDPYTAAHSKRVSQLARLVAAGDGFSVGEQFIIETYGRLHDMGKIGIPDAILLKNASLDDQEFLKIMQHPDKGERMLLRYNKHAGNASKNGRDILRHHHERFDGKGYPDGLGKDDIPKAARILNIVDSFDAMASNRCYRDALTEKEIIKRIKKDMKKQFDPNYVHLFLDILPSVAYADLENREKVYHSPFSLEALEIPAESFIAARRSDFEKYGFRPFDHRSKLN
jgi:HD-GYP domain-containing protein (c-di-GMP phosphodiesterase class II)